MIDQLTVFVAAVAGGVLWSLVAIVTAIAAPTSTDVRKALINSAAAVASSAIGGWFVAPGIIYYLRITEIQLVNLVGLMTGLVFWKTLPSLINVVSSISISRITALFGGSTK